MLVEITSNPTLPLANISLLKLSLLPILTLHSKREGGIGGGGGGGRGWSRIRPSFHEQGFFLSPL